MWVRAPSHPIPLTWLFPCRDKHTYRQESQTCFLDRDHRVARLPNDGPGKTAWQGGGLHRGAAAWRHCCCCREEEARARDRQLRSMEEEGVGGVEEAVGDRGSVHLHPHRHLRPQRRHAGLRRTPRRPRARVRLLRLHRPGRLQLWPLGAFVMPPPICSISSFLSLKFPSLPNHSMWSSAWDGLDRIWCVFKITLFSKMVSNLV